MRVEQQAREIQEQLGGLRQQFDGFWAAFQTVGAHLANAQKRFEESERQAGRVQERFEPITGVVDGAAPEAPGPMRRGSWWMPVYVTGGTGYNGVALPAALPRAGHR